RLFGQAGRQWRRGQGRGGGRTRSLEEIAARQAGSIFVVSLVVAHRSGPSPLCDEWLRSVCRSENRHFPHLGSESNCASGSDCKEGARREQAIYGQKNQKGGLASEF